MAKCPLCNSRKPKRTCPALGRQICAVCCGTKRKVEINCPEDCTYLTASKAHPPAVVQRQFERDMGFLLPFFQRLTEAQFELMRAFMALTLKHTSDAIPPLFDADIGDAAATVASTLETADRGIIYQHQAHSVPAQHLAGTLETFVRQLAADAGVHARAVERDSAVALRELAAAAQAARKTFPESSDRAFVDLLGRIMVPDGGSREGSAKLGDAPRLIIPG